MKYNISYKLDKYIKFGTLTKYDDGNMGLIVTEEQLEKLLQVIKVGHFNDKKVKEYNKKKYITLNVFEDDGKYTKEQNNNVTLKSDDFVPF